MSWENKIRVEFNAPQSKYNFKRIILEKIDSSESLHTLRISRFARKSLGRLKNTDGKASIYVRNILSRLFPFDPLISLNQDRIRLYFLVAEKDLQILPYSIVAGLQSVTNIVDSIYIVCPLSVKHKAQESIAPLVESFAINLEIYTDEEILKKAKIESMDFTNSYSKMQVLKICLSYVSDKCTLIIDADTLLLRERNWVSNGIQISPISQEYQKGYNTFVAQVFRSNEITGLGFVTHHGLLNSEKMKGLVANCGGIEKLVQAIDAGIAKGWNLEFGFPSEWQLYGEYIFSQEANSQAIPAGFVNLGISRNVLSLLDAPTYADCELLINRLRMVVPKLGSLSLHAYKEP